MADTVLVTGAGGFIGSRLVESLRGHGREVRTHSHADGDIASSFTPTEDVSVVVHLAARGFVRESWEETAEFYRVNVQGTVRVLEFCRRHQARMVFVSTYVYGAATALPTPEDHPRSAPSPYHHSKILAEDACLFYARQFEVPVAVIRLFNVYGPGQGSGFVIPTLMKQALDPNVKEITVTDLRPRRDYLYIADFIQLVELVLERRAGGVYNAGSGVSVSVGELVKEITRAAGTNKPVVCRNEFRKNEIMDVCADIEKARRDLGWSPRVRLAEGLARVRDAMASACV
jgi:nucleoside-diphosphate-sugar epimerase